MIVWPSTARGVVTIQTYSRRNCLSWTCVRDALEELLTVRDWSALACNGQLKRLTPRGVAWARRHRLDNALSRWTVRDLPKVDLEPLVELFAIGVNFGFFRQCEVFWDKKLNFNERRQLKILGCAEVDAHFVKDEDLRVTCYARCFVSLGGRKAVANAQWHLVNKAYDLAGICTHRSGLVVGGHPVCAVVYDTPRKFYRLIDDAFDTWAGRHLGP